MNEATQILSASTSAVGGAREGSGRKKKDGKKVTFFLSIHAIALLKALAKDSGSSNMTAENERAIRDRAAAAGIAIPEEEEVAL